MISQKLSAMQSRLQALGMDNNDIDRYLAITERDIREGIADVLSSAVHEAADFGRSKGADEFLQEIKLDEDSGYIQISTDSGRMDFSKQPFPMLPWLLKNAKTAKDGSRYKVIPVGAKSTQTAKPQKSIEEGIAALRGSKRGVSDMASDMAAAFGLGANNKITPPKGPEAGNAMGSPSFRVASSKQDPNSTWVQPEKDLDMSSTIMEINLRIRQQIDHICDDVIDLYMREAEEWHG